MAQVPLSEPVLPRCLFPHLTLHRILVKCLDSDEQEYPAPSSSALVRTALASVWQSETQSSMDEFVAASESSS